MNHKNSNEEIKRYEKEFSEFLIEKINHAGGSLQFQHLSGILQQLRFEVRDAVASSKPELMKFLRTHTKIFKIDSKGVVSVVNCILHKEEEEDDNNTEQDNVPAKKNFLAKIDNGEGTVIKVTPEFAIIAAVIPIKTLVYFTPSEYGADNKDCLFGIDIDLGPRTKVCFNADHGHSDYGIEYRATNVWTKPDSEDEKTKPQNHKKNKNVENLLSGKGMVKKVYPNFGIISVFNRENETVLFYKSSIEDSGTDVAKFLKVGDHVEFTAKPANAGSEAKWQALNVIKMTLQSCNQLSSDFAENTKNLDTNDNNKRNRIENQPGKIYGYANGAVIKFGKDYSQKADGDSSDYYLYGYKIKVSDIIWEFSEGDDVLFDAVKIKRLPGWKAYLVWTGEKPACRNIPKVEDDSDEITEEQSSSSVVSSDSSKSLMRSRIKDNKYFSPENKENKKGSTMHTRCNSRMSDKFQNEYDKESHSKAKNNDRNTSVHLSKFKKANYKSDKRYLALNKFAKENRNVLFTEHLSYAVECDKNLLTSKESASNSHIENSEDSPEEDDEYHDAASIPKKFLKEEKYDYSSSSSEEKIIYDNESNEVRQNSENELISKKASIKKFDNIEGTISAVFCKAAIIRCPFLQRDVDFVLSALYLHGESAEERQIIDLKEIIHVGDKVNFNCFEIIDDLGNLTQKVTMAWIGPKPEIYEMTTEDFIRQNELSVSLYTNTGECRSENEVNHIEFRSSENNDKTDFYSETESALNETVNNKSSGEPEGEIFENLNDSDHSSVTEEEEESLSSKIIQKLKIHGLFSEDSQVNLKIVPEIIDLVLNKYGIINSGSHTMNQDWISSKVLCPSCLNKNMSFSNKDTTAKHAAVQTIITGEIVATRGDFRARKVKGAKYSSG